MKDFDAVVLLLSLSKVCSRETFGRGSYTFVLSDRAQSISSGFRLLPDHESGRAPQLTYIFK